MPFPIPDFGQILFFLIIFLVIVSAFWVVVSPNLVHSAVSLLFTFFGVDLYHFYMQIYSCFK